MSKTEFSDKLPPAKKLTPEVIRANPHLKAIARTRLRQIKEAKSR